MKRDRHPAYDLSEIQQKVRAGQMRITLAARDGAARLGLQEADIVRYVLRLRRSDFYKSMPSERQSALWQDVYRPTFAGTQLYIKLQLSLQDDAVVISFKER